MIHGSSCSRCRIRLVAYMKNNKGALLQHCDGFSWFDSESNSLKAVSIHGICGVFKKYSAQICVGSLFRLRERKRNSTREMKMRMRNCREMMQMTAHSMLTLCIRDYDKNDSPSRASSIETMFKQVSHDSCYGSDSNWYKYSSGDGHKLVRRAPILNPGIDSSSVPLDICREIFLRLPAKTLIRFRAVCNPWKAVIDDPSFAKAHTNKQLSSNTSNIIIRNSTGPPFYPLFSFDLDGLDFTNGLQRISSTPLYFTPSGLSRLQVLPMATCNGLMLVAPITTEKNEYDDINWDWDRKGAWEIWNPLTHERLQLPQLDLNSHLTAWGLGYDYATDDYKAVVIDYEREYKPVGIIDGLPCYQKPEHQTHVYSLKSDSWRSIGNNCPYDGWGHVGRGAFLNGVLYWLAKDKIFAFDLGTENYLELKHPILKDKMQKFNRWKQIDVLSECLIVSDYFHDDCSSNLVLWVMEVDIDGAQGGSWVKLLSIYERHIRHFGKTLRPVAYMKNKMQILLHDDRLGFYLFDMKSKSAKMVSIHGLTGNLYVQVVPESLFRIHDNCAVNITGKRRMIMKKTTGNMKMPEDTELTFCVRNDGCRSWSGDDDIHESCYTLDANWYYSSSEDEDY